MTNIILIGNGILSLMSALRLTQRNEKYHITIIGPNNREGCASVAAPAMLNAYAELTKGALDDTIDRQKFEISRLASKAWKSIFTELTEYTIPKIEPSFGTYILNNATTDYSEDINFNAIIEYLEEYDEHYEYVDICDIPGYNPSSKGRALKAIYLKDEGFVNSEFVLDYLVDYLKNNGVNFIDQKVFSLNKNNNTIESVTLENKETIKADKFILAPGANFSTIINNSNLNINFQRILYGSGVTMEIRPKVTNFTHCVRTPNRGMACGIYSAPRTTDTIFIGASNLVADYGLKNPMLTSLESLLKASMEQINTAYYNAEFIGTKIGWRPTSEDTYPLLGKCSINNLIIATGTKRDGFHMSPIISQYLVHALFNETFTYEKLFANFDPERAIIRNIPRDKAIRDIVNHQISAMYQHDFIEPKNDMLNDYRKKLEQEAIEVHDKVGAHEWGIPPELYSMYKGGYLACGCAG